MLTETRNQSSDQIVEKTEIMAIKIEEDVNLIQTKIPKKNEILEFTK